MACLVNSLGDILDDGKSNRIREEISEEQNSKKESLEYVIISSEEDDIDPDYYVNQTQSLEYVIIHSDEDEIEYPGISIANQTQTDNSHEETSENKSKYNQDQNPIQTDISHEETTENESKDHQDQNPTQADNNHEETTETTFPDVNEKEKPPKVTLSDDIYFFDENVEDDDDNAKNYDDQNDISHEVGKEEEDGPKVKSKDDPKNDPNSDRDGSGVDDDDVYLASLDKDEIDEIIQDVFL